MARLTIDDLLDDDDVTICAEFLVFDGGEVVARDQHAWIIFDVSKTFKQTFQKKRKGRGTDAAKCRRHKQFNCTAVGCR